MKLKTPPANHHLQKIRNVWDNSHYQDFGIERLVRLFLVSSRVLFPGVYIELFCAKLSNNSKKISGELYVVFKTIMPLLMLYYNLWHHQWLFVLNIYLLFETFLYVFYKIFLPEHNKKKLVNRSVILLFFNFFEVIASFAVVYARGNYLNMPINSWVDALYFSFITGVTIGYGDFYPITEKGKVLVMLQIISTISFLFLFFNFFAPRVQDSNEWNSDAE